MSMTIGQLIEALQDKDQDEEIECIVVNTKGVIRTMYLNRNNYAISQIFHFFGEKYHADYAASTGD